MTMIHAAYVRDFEYVPVAPYIIQEVSISAADGETYERQTLGGAVALFGHQFLPVRWGWMCSLIDGTGRIVLQYYAKIEAVVPDWWGVSATFAELERIGLANPVDLAIYETIARENAA